MRGLIVRAPWAGKIVDGTKPIEYRSRPTNIRGRIAILESKTCVALGEATLTDCTGPHPDGYHWHLVNPVKYPEPKPYKHKNGAVVWLDIEP